jgi:hypothetical protein
MSDPGRRDSSSFTKGDEMLGLAGTGDELVGLFVIVFVLVALIVYFARRG